MKNASALGAHLDDNEAINLDALKMVILRMKKPTRRERPSFTPVHPVDYMKGRHDVRVLRYDDPSKYEKAFFGDVRFWLRFHADWYESVILCKSHPSTEMKSINWLYFNEVNLSVIEQVNEACNNKFLHLIMEFNHDWNEEVVAQFYATLYIGRAAKVMHWTLQGKPLSVTYVDFTSILGYGGSYLTSPKIHDENVIEDGEMAFMYDIAYGPIEHGTTKGMIPYYRLLNQLFRYTLCPKGGDSDNISNMSKNLLSWMHPDKGDFNVFDFIWEEIIICSYSPKKSCHYASYIFAMIKEVTNLDILIDKAHPVYKPKKGQLERLLKIGSHAIRFPPPSTSQGAPAS